MIISIKVLVKINIFVVNYQRKNHTKKKESNYIKNEYLCFFQMKILMIDSIIYNQLN
jgi:hypothetical protein